MTATERDRERATRIVIEWGSGDLSPTRQRDLIAAALADERERARAPFVKVAEELEGGQAEALASMRALHLAERPALAEAYGYRANAYAFAAARLRAAAEDAES